MIYLDDNNKEKVSRKVRYNKMFKASIQRNREEEGMNSWENF